MKGMTNTDADHQGSRRPKPRPRVKIGAIGQGERRLEYHSMTTDYNMFR